MEYSSECVCNNLKCLIKKKGFRPYSCVDKKFWRYSFLQGKVIVFEGLVGAGKSSAAKETARFLRDDCKIPAVYLPEYVDEELLKMFIQDMKTHAYTFQLFMLERRAEIYRKALDLAQLGHVVIMDRMMFGDLAFAFLHFKEGNISPEQFDNYRRRLNSFEFNDPSITIFLKVSPECAATRARKRNRKGETYDLNYFKAVSEAYEKVLEKYGGEILYVDYEKDLLIEELTPKIEEILELILKHLME